MHPNRKKVSDFFSEKSIVKQYGAQKDFNLLSRKRIVFKFLKDIPFRKVLDMGCGSGGYLGLKKHYDCIYYGLDFSENMLRSAKNMVKELDIMTGVSFHKASAEKTPFKDNSFDLIIAIGLIEYFEKPFTLISEIRRILKLNGFLIIQSYLPSIYVEILSTIFLPIKNMVVAERHPLNHKKYKKRQLDHLLMINGFLLKDFSYSNLHLFPKPLNKVFPTLHIKFSEYLSRKDSKKFGFMAVNYVGSYNLTEK